MTPFTWLIFTDLDETLLDRETYSFEPARPALDEIRRRGIPLIPATTKTAAETRPLMEKLGLEGPFIVEGGGGVHLPPRLIALAPPYAEILRRMAPMKPFTRGFHQMSTGEIARLTGLPPESAALARQREFDEPFVLLDPAREPDLPRLAAAAGVQLTRGGRFWHLHGETDKGRALGLVKSYFEKKLGPVRTLALGDSDLDRPMLAVADVAVLMPRRDGTVDPRLAAALPQARQAPHPGPEGWNRMVLDVIS